MQYPPDLKSFCKALAYDRRQALKWRMVSVHKYHHHRKDARLQWAGETGYWSRG